jgi:Class II Aldolase and Adducin N-terminal domain
MIGAIAGHSALLRNHGPVVSGPSLSSALDDVEELEDTAQLFLLLHDHAHGSFRRRNTRSWSAMTRPTPVGRCRPKGIHCTTQQCAHTKE